MEKIMEISDMINHIQSGEMTKANAVLNDMLAQKQAAALDQEKISIAQTIFNGTEEDPEDEQLELDLEDDEPETIDTTDEEDLEDEELTEYEFEDDEN
jgi:hypothetical protein